MEGFRKNVFIFLVVTFALAAFACQGMTPKQKAAGVMLTYNKAYDDYLVRVQDPGLTEEQKEILARQKAILGQLYPKIKLYVEYAETGKLPYRGIEAEINNLIFELEKLVLKDIE